MQETLKHKITTTYNKYWNEEEVDLKIWVFSEVGQVITTVSQVNWTSITENAIEQMEASEGTMLDAVKQLTYDQLSQMTELIRGNLNSIDRRMLVSKITTDVHNR
jgi:dynein heavy chain